MYQRIKNRLDAKLLLQDMRDQGEHIFVGDRILELVGILDDNYGSLRNSHAMGGYILYFPDVNTYENTVVEIWDYYNIEPTLYEYKEFIGDSELESTQWIEKLFLLSSDDSLVLIYPQEAGAR